MRRITFVSALIVALQVNIAALAQNDEVTLRVPNFIRPLAEKWVAEYQKEGGAADFQFATGQSQAEGSIIVFTNAEGAIPFARYAVLPVTASGSEASRLIGKHRLNARKLKNLFFVKDEFEEEDDEPEEDKSPLHIYAGGSATSASNTYAAHFKQEESSYKGKKIVGDDSFLLTAIGRDPLGVTVNSLPNIFDLGSRQVRQELALLPLDVDRRGRQTLDEGNLDNIIALLEGQQFAEIPVGNIGVTYDRNNESQCRFVRWIMEKGVGYVHEFGLLQLPQKELATSLRLTSNHHLAQRSEE